MKKIVLILMIFGMMATSCGVSRLTITDTRTNKTKEYRLKDITFTPDSLIATQVLANHPTRKFRPFQVPLDAFPYYEFTLNKKKRD